mgnify:CR=1 FL=1
MLDRGYYEDLTDVVRFNSGLGDIYNQRPPDWDRNWAMHPIEGCPDYEMQPNKRVLHKGAVVGREGGAAGAAGLAGGFHERVVRRWQRHSLGGIARAGLDEHDRGLAPEREPEPISS